MRFLVGGLLFINTAIIIYFVYTFERLFLIMKAGSLTDLLKYQQSIKFPPKEKEDEDSSVY